MKNENMDKAKEFSNQETSTHSKLLMTWTTKAPPRDTVYMDIGMAILTLIGLTAITNGFYEIYVILLPEPERSVFLSLHAGIVWTLMCVYLWILVVRQKKIYTYTISDASGIEESRLNFPKAAATIFKVISALFLASIIGIIAYDPALFIMLAGPAGMAIIAAKFFLSCDNTPHIEKSSNWGDYKFVTIDRKRNIIVAQESELMVGFEARPTKELFENYIETLRKILPLNAVFTERDWIW